MALVRQFISPILIIVLAIIIRSFLSLPIIEVNGDYLSTDDVISHTEKFNEVRENAFSQHAENNEVLIAIHNDISQAHGGDIEVLRNAFDVVASIADFIIVITVFFVLPVCAKRKHNNQMQPTPNSGSAD